MALQRGYAGGTLSSITYFPGARFIIAGLLSRPGSYYKVQRDGRVQRHLPRQVALYVATRERLSRLRISGYNHSQVCRIQNTSNYSYLEGNISLL